MNVHRPPRLMRKRVVSAAWRGVPIDVLLRVGRERVVDHDEWFLGEVAVGLAQIESGQTHAVVEARLARKLANASRH